MKLTAFICLGIMLSPGLSLAAENPANMPMGDVDQSLQELDKEINQSSGALSQQKLQGFQAQENTLSERVAKVKAAGTVTAAEHASLLAAIQAQEKQIQAALPKPRPVDSAALPGTTAGFVQGGYGSTTTIGPNGAVVMSNGPVVNGVPTGDTIVQPAAR